MPNCQFSKLKIYANMYFILNRMRHNVSWKFRVCSGSWILRTGATQTGWFTELSWQQQTAHVCCRHFHSSSLFSIHCRLLRQPRMTSAWLLVTWAGFRAETMCRDRLRSEWRPQVTNEGSRGSIKSSSLPLLPTPPYSFNFNSCEWDFLKFSVNWEFRGNQLREMG